MSVLIYFLIGKAIYYLPYCIFQKVVQGCPKTTLPFNTYPTYATARPPEITLFTMPKKLTSNKG